MTSNYTDGACSPILTTSVDIGNDHSDCITYTSLSSPRPFLPPIESSSILQIVGHLNIPVSNLDQLLVPSNHFKPIESVADPLPYPHASDTRISVSNYFY